MVKTQSILSTLGKLLLMLVTGGVLFAVTGWVLSIELGPARSVAWQGVFLESSRVVEEGAEDETARMTATRVIEVEQGSILTSRPGWMYAAKTWKESTLDSELDVLALGSSLTIRGMAPRIFESAGLRMRVLGIANSPPGLLRQLLLDYQQVSKAKVIAMEVIRGDPRVSFETGFMAAGAAPKMHGSLLWFLVRQGRPSLSRFSLARYFNFIEPGNMNLLKQETMLCEYYKGACSYPVGSVQPELPPDPPKAVSAAERSQAWLDEMSELVVTAATDGTKIILIDYPNTRSAIPEASDRVKAMAALHSGQVVYVDANAADDYKAQYPGDFYDKDGHLLQEAANRFSQWVLGQMKKEGFISEAAGG